VKALRRAIEHLQADVEAEALGVLYASAEWYAAQGKEPAILAFADVFEQTVRGVRVAA
jgi:hypothetical protein